MLDSRDKKVKYRSFRFKKELEKARLYKRPARHVPETKLEIFFARLGLASWHSKLLLSLVFIGLIYLAYIPNFLFVQSIEIQGEQLAHETEHRQAISDFLDRSRAWPQKNLLLLNTAGLRKKLESESWVISVDKIQKKWPNRLIIKITERRQFARVISPEAGYIFSNDGHRLEILENSSTPPSNLVLINSLASSGPGEELPSASMDLIKLLQNKIPEICQTAVAAYNIYPGANPDVEAETASGFKLIFDTSLDNKDTFENLSVLFSKLSKEEKSRLAYIDLRIKNKAFTCFKGTSCTESTKFMTPFAENGTASSASSTLISPQ